MKSTLAVAAVCLIAAIAPGVANANGKTWDNPHPGADKQQSSTHGDCKNPGDKSDTHDTTGNHNGYDCGPEQQSPPPSSCTQNCNPTEPQSNPQQSCPCSCPTQTTSTTNTNNITVKAYTYRHHHRRHHHHKRHHHRRYVPHFLG